MTEQEEYRERIKWALKAIDRQGEMLRELRDLPNLFDDLMGQPCCAYCGTRSFGAICCPERRLEGIGR